MCAMLEWFSEATACASNATRTGHPLENRVGFGEVKSVPQHQGTSINHPVPEPATSALAALGLLDLAGC